MVNLSEAPLIDLLQTDVFAEYASRPALLRERYSAPEASKHRGPIVLDEVQKLTPRSVFPVPTTARLRRSR